MYHVSDRPCRYSNYKRIHLRSSIQEIHNLFAVCWASFQRGMFYNSIVFFRLGKFQWGRQNIHVCCSQMYLNHNCCKMPFLRHWSFPPCCIVGIASNLGRPEIGTNQLGTFDNQHRIYQHHRRCMKHCLWWKYIYQWNKWYIKLVAVY